MPLQLMNRIARAAKAGFMKLLPMPPKICFTRIMNLFHQNNGQQTADDSNPHRCICRQVIGQQQAGNNSTPVTNGRLLLRQLFIEELGQNSSEHGNCNQQCCMIAEENDACNAGRSQSNAHILHNPPR